MRGYQASFSSGEISPLLHGRIDLARYATGLSKLENMIVLPQGGVTRRAGFTNIGTYTNVSPKLIPFVYNATDSAMIVIGDGLIRIFGQIGTGYSQQCTLYSPYNNADIKDLRYAQSGNVIFLAHKNFYPQILRRISATSWTLESLPFRNGPFISGDEWAYGVKLTINGMTVTSSGSVFQAEMEGTLLRMEYSVDAKTLELTSQLSPNTAQTNPFEVKGTLNVSTSGDWNGTITIERSSDGGDTWVKLRQYKRTDSGSQGQWDITITETEENILYRVKAQHVKIGAKVTTTYVGSSEGKTTGVTTGGISISIKEADEETDEQDKETGSSVTPEDISGSTDIEDEEKEDKEKEAIVQAAVQAAVQSTVQAVAQAINGSAYQGASTEKTQSTSRVTQTTAEKANAAEISISASGFLKREIYEITSVGSSTYARVKRQDEIASKIADIIGETPHTTQLWGIGSWGFPQGFPRAVTLYQDRLIFAGSKYEPQTIWMSRTGDYADFGTSDPLRDDDAVNITLGGTYSDGIHSLVSGSSLLAFTKSGEWEIRGSSDGGAISPTGISAHESTAIGSKDIQPLKVNGKIIMVQTQGQKVYALGYDLNTDGYSGSEISIMSSHIFEGKEITSMAYQQNPDSLLWFSLNDGTAAVCTDNPEHEVIGWSRQSNPTIKFGEFTSIPSEQHSEIFSEGQNGNTRVLMIERDRLTTSDYRDISTEYESVMQTLRLTGSGEDGVNYASKKLIARLVIYALNSTQAWAAPKDWERRQKVYWAETDGLREAEIEMDNGFDEDACIQIRNMGNTGLTIVAISPLVMIGG